MEREEQTTASVVELGTASADTQGPMGDTIELNQVLFTSGLVFAAGIVD